MSLKPPSRGTSKPLNRKKSLQPRLSSFNLKPDIEQDISVKSAKITGTRISKSKGNVSSSKRSAPESKEKSQKVQYDSEATKKFDSMIEGDLTDLPPLPKSMVRIFLSSTFSDMRQERNILAREVYPKLRDYCSQFGLAFQVVDMRWGVTDDSQNDHSVEKICLLEVKNCQNVSKGPNFVVLSGDRYGFRPIPVEVEVDEFEKIIAMATKMSLPNKDLLSTWYKKDENAVPSLYVLQPIRSKFTFFGDYSPGCDEPRKKDTADWLKTFDKLQDVLRTCANELYKQKKLSEERHHTYFYSVTECEIEEGVLMANDVNSHCLVYQRKFKDLNNSAAADQDATRFKEFKVIDGVSQVDTEVEELRESLRKNRIRTKLSDKNIRAFTVPWIPGGLDPAQSKHQEYLQSFCNNFIEDCQNLIQKAVIAEQSLIPPRNYYTNYEETIHHLRFCLTKCQSFCGQENILEAAKSYILDESGRRPLIIHAESGAGKTSIMAMIMKNIPDWLNNKSHVKLIRFLGTSPKSNNIYDVLFSVLGQLSDAYDMIMSPICYKNIKNLVEFVPRYLRQVASNAKEPIIILLDSIDQLYPDYKAHSMEWLPTLLPQNVKLILSTLPREHDILDNVKRILPNEECYINVPLLTNTAAQLISDTYLKISQRKLTDTQMKLLLSVFKGSPSPLFLKLLLDMAKQWPSYIEYSALELLPSTVQLAINKLFENLEKKFGLLLTSHALGYITIGLGGLTDIEIEDVLSCDDAVLNDLYRYHDPPVPGIVRVPPLLWARIRFDLKEYLVERLSYGKNTLNWYHRQFIETARSRYVSDSKDIELHKNLTEIYLQDVGIKRTIILKKRKNLEVPDADRQVTPQPFESQNKRKLACLPYHAIQAYTMIGPDIGKGKIFCNFKYLCTKIESFSLSEAVSDFSSFLDKNEDDEVTILRNYLSVAKDNLTQPIRLAVCLLAYIKPEENHKYLKDLQDQCLNYLNGQKSPLLIPEFPCLAPRQDASSALNTSLQGYKAILAQSENCFLLQAKKDEDSSDDLPEYAIFNTNTEDIQHYNLSDNFKNMLGSYYRLNGKHLLYITKTSLISYNLHTSKSTQFVFAEKIPKWNPRSSEVTQFYMDIEADIGILVMKSYLIHINLTDLTFVQQFDSRRKFAQIQNCLIFKTVEGFKVLASGKMINSPDDEQQGPDNSSFITIFESGKEAPTKFVQLDKDIDSGNLTLAAKNGWSVGVLQDVKQTENDNTEQNDTTTCSLLTFKCSEPFTHTDVPIPGNVDKLSGNPNKPEVLVLSQNGNVYLVDIENSKTVLEIKLNYPIKNFDVIWDEGIAFLCFGQGNIGMYDLAADKNLGSFSAHSTLIREIVIVDQQAVTLGTSFDLKLWSIQQMVEKAKHEDKMEKSDNELLDQMEVKSFIVIGSELITCSTDGYLRSWDSDSHVFLRQHHIEIEVSVILEMVNDVVVLLDEAAGKLLVFDVFSGQPVLKTSDFPHKVLSVVTDHAKEKLYIISEVKKYQLHIDIYNIQLSKFTKSFGVQKGFTFISMSAILTPSERFLVLKAGISETEYESIKKMWKKGNFMEQPHRFKFGAIDLSQGNGALMPCLRRLTKIPTLGTNMCQYRANTVLITTRRWVGFWDIPSGNYDQRPVKNDKSNGMFYRPGWLGQQCKGTSNAMAISDNKEYLAVGSEDGYVFIYDAEIGIPRNSVKPKTYHKADVRTLTISPNSKWVASGCLGSVLKLWDSSDGKEVFSMRLDAPAQKMYFTADSRKLVLYTGSQTTRIIVLRVHEESL